MRVFITGATGFIGSAVTATLIKHGHQVLGLTRSDKGAEALKAAGAEAHLGALDDLESLKRGAAACDAVLHLAFNHDLTDYEGNCRADCDAITAMGAAIENTNKPLIITSGTLLLPLGRLGHEDDAHAQDGFAAVRGASEDVALSLVANGVTAQVVRLPPSNHGEGDKAFVASMSSKARETGESLYIGEGKNVWPATHRLDTAEVYRLALEKGKAGAIWHAVAEEGIPLRDIAEAIGKIVGVPAVSKTSEQANERFGFIGFAMAGDNPVSSAKTRELLGWKPVQPTLLEDNKAAIYSKA